jgi:uncharacterized membrane protein YhaH (DUF805 family)
VSWYIYVLKHYAQFHGRARRREYWMYILVNLVVTAVLYAIDNADNLSSVSLIYSLATIIPTFAVGSRRLHDTGRSGWWQLLYLIPIVGSIVVIVMMCLDSKPGDNKYGPNPKHRMAEQRYAEV